MNAQQLIGSNIREARKKAGLTQRAIYELIGMRKTTQSRYETGERLINLRNLIAICAVLRVELYDIITADVEELLIEEWDQ